jgi:hypothetical protein
MNLVTRSFIVVLGTVMTFTALCGVLALEFSDPEKRPKTTAAAGPSGGEAKAVDDNENRLGGIVEDLQMVKMEIFEDSDA